MPRLHQRNKLRWCKRGIRSEVLTRRRYTNRCLPYLYLTRLVDPTAVTLPLQSMPMDEVRGPLRMQYETPVIGKTPHTAGQIPPTQPVESLHYQAVECLH